MKIAVFGGDREIVDHVIKKLEKRIKTVAVKPKLESTHPIIDMAKETYGQTKRKNVIYDGCVLQFLSPDMEDENLFDVYEQIVLTSLVNIDRVFVITEGIDEKMVDFYNDYNDFVDGKITFVKKEDEIIL